MKYQIKGDKVKSMNGKSISSEDVLTKVKDFCKGVSIYSRDSDGAKFTMSNEEVQPYS